MDILFVIDDSGSMSEEQGNLVANFPRFIEVLDGFVTDGGAALDYRIGVTTTGKDTTTIIEFPPSFPVPPMTLNETGPNGALLWSSECGMSRNYISRSDPDVAGTFSCIAAVGTGGSGVEMPLGMTARAVSDRVADGMNSGFLREDALLAIIILTDEDDCTRYDDPITIMVPDPLAMPAASADECDPSAPEIETLESILAIVDGVKGDRGRWAAAVIAGPTSCSSSFGVAAAATRLQDFIGRVGPNGTFSSICEGDLSGGLMGALDTFDAACQAFPPLI